MYASSLKPDTFDMRRLFGVSGSLGVLMTVESAIFAVPALSYFGLIGNVEKIYTFGFAYLNLAGVSTLMIVRERNHFWKSKPSKFLSITVLAEVLFVIAISIFGVLELAPLGYSACSRNPRICVANDFRDQRPNQGVPNTQI